MCMKIVVDVFNLQEMSFHLVSFFPRCKLYFISVNLVIVHTYIYFEEYVTDLLPIMKYLIIITVFKNMI